MSKIEIEKPDDMPEDIARFTAENELKRRQRRRKAVEGLDLEDEDLELLEEAREEVWKERKKKLL